MIQKRFVKYSVEDLRSLARLVPQIRAMGATIRNDVGDDAESFLKKAVTPFFWSKAYELDFNKHLACAIASIGAQQEIAALAASENPQAAALQCVQQEQAAPLPKPIQDPVQYTQAFGLLFSLLRSVDSLCLHGRLLNELIQDVRKGSDLALFKAVQVDRAVLSCAPVADRIAWAEVVDDGAFFKKLSNALRTRPKKPKEEYASLRYVLYALEEVGALESLSIEQAYELFHLELDVYDDKGSDTARSLWQFISRWKKVRST